MLVDVYSINVSCRSRKSPNLKKTVSCTILAEVGTELQNAMAGVESLSQVAESLGELGSLKDFDSKILAVQCL